MNISSLKLKGALMFYGCRGNPKIKKYAHLLGKIPDKEFAELVGCHPKYPYFLRKKQGMLCKRSGWITGMTVDWERFDHLFGREEDEKIAEIVGRSLRAVRNRRRTLKVPPFFYPVTCPCGNTFTPTRRKRRHCSTLCQSVYWYYVNRSGLSDSEIEAKMWVYGENKRKNKRKKR